MALFTRLKAISRLENTIRIGLAFKSGFHSFTNTTRSLFSYNAAPKIGQRTYFFEIFKKPSQRELKIKDDVPDAFELIYRNTMSKYILGAQIISVIAGGFVFLAFILKSEFKNTSENFQTWSPAARTTENEEYYYITFFIVFLVLMQVMISRTPIRIYKVPQTSKYICINYGNYFFGKEKFSFKRGEIAHMEERGILPWKENKYAIESETDRRIVILLEHYFRRPADLNIMLGEQKDPDLDEKS